MSWRTNPLVYSDPDTDTMDATDADDMAVRVLRPNSRLLEVMTQGGASNGQIFHRLKRSHAFSNYCIFMLFLPNFSSYLIPSNTLPSNLFIVQFSIFHLPFFSFANPFLIMVNGRFFLGTAHAHFQPRFTSCRGRINASHGSSIKYES